jgi:putative ABC transport system substrate-binding protein
MRRREFIGLVGAAAAWPLAAPAQRAAMPTIGFLASPTAQGYEYPLADVHAGLGRVGFEEGRNVAIEYRWADGDYARLPRLAAELAQRPVQLIFATGSIMSAIAAKAATNTIPVVFANGSDPVKFGVVPSLSRPGGNVTGVSFVNNELGPKRIELLKELLPKAAVFGVAVNPNNPAAVSDAEELQTAGRLAGVRIVLLKVATESELPHAFAAALAERADALLITNDALFQSRGRQIAALAARNRLPAMYSSRRQVSVGGLISYGTNVGEMYRQAAVYAGRILKGESPANLPVLQPTTFEIVINTAAARALGIDIPATLLARADEVIE